MNVPSEAVALTGRQSTPGLLICASVLVASLLILQKWSVVAAAGWGAMAAAIVEEWAAVIITSCGAYFLARWAAVFS
jgi:hypothetical protein